MGTSVQRKLGSNDDPWDDPGRNESIGISQSFQDMLHPSLLLHDHYFQSYDEFSDPLDYDYYNLYGFILCMISIFSA